MNQTSTTPVHYVANYLLNPTHPLTVTLVGTGGTGSQVLSSLTSLHLALVELGHPGLHVTAYDGDRVSKANLGRGRFFPSDVGENKSVVLISRINRSFGLNWRAVPCHYNMAFLAGIERKNSLLTNLLITCVDSAKARIEIGEMMKKTGNYAVTPYQQPYYWLDFGNAAKTGQVVLGTLHKIKQPKEDKQAVSELPTVLQMFEDIAGYDKSSIDIPSCSMAEALVKQDLFINATLTQFGMNLIWKLLREVKITMHGAYVNLEHFRVNAIPIQKAA